MPDSPHEIKPALINKLRGKIGECAHDMLVADVDKQFMHVRRNASARYVE